jgi:hypothetical protein
MNLQNPDYRTHDVTTVDVEKCKSIGMNDYISKPLTKSYCILKFWMYLNLKDNKRE